MVLVLVMGLGLWVTTHRAERLMQEFDTKDVSLVVINTGPYFPNKDVQVYRVRRGSETYWVKYGFGRTTIQEISPGKYKELP